MNREKQIRRLRHLIHKHDGSGHFHIYNSLIEYLDKQIEYTENVPVKIIVEKNKALKEIKKIVIENNITNDEYLKIVHEERKRVYMSYENLKINTLKETRDNKGVYVGGGGSNANKVRYPKKTRSKRTWKIFYKMFPRKAEQDGWDGQKSNKVSK